MLFDHFSDGNDAGEDRGQGRTEEEKMVGGSDIYPGVVGDGCCVDGALFGGGSYCYVSVAGGPNFEVEGKH